jgi:hypothetical protein
MLKNDVIFETWFLQFQSLVLCGYNFYCYIKISFKSIETSFVLEKLNFVRFLLTKIARVFQWAKWGTGLRRGVSYGVAPRRKAMHSRLLANLAVRTVLQFCRRCLDVVYLLYCWLVGLISRFWASEVQKEGEKMFVVQVEKESVRRMRLSLVSGFQWGNYVLPQIGSSS